MGRRKINNLKFLSILSVSIAAGALVTPLHAADLGGTPYRPSIKDEPVYAPRVYNWTGLYFGAHAGAVFNHDPSASTTGTAAFQSLTGPGIAPSSLSLDDSGFIGGGQVGYNIQSGGVVWGVEADLSYLGLDAESSFTGNPVLGTRLQTTAGLEYGAFGTVRARIGVLPMDSFLLYATGGLAIADVTTKASVTSVDVPGLAWSGETNDTQIGYTVGFGGEYAFTPNMTLKVEYLYFDLGDQSATATGNALVRATPALNGVDYSNKVDLDGSIVRAGLNFKF